MIEKDNSNNVWRRKYLLRRLKWEINVKKWIF